MKDNVLAPYLGELALATSWIPNSKQTKSTESEGAREGGRCKFFPLLPKSLHPLDIEKAFG